jgi:hypothetical protein
MEMINMPEANLTTFNPLNLSGLYRDGWVEQLGKSGNSLALYDFKNLFPTEIEAIDLNWGTNDEIEEFTVTFAYDLWTRGDSSTISQVAGVVGQVAGVIQATQ